LAECARRSLLMQNWPIAIIPYPLDLQRWSPLQQATARGLLGLPLDRPLVVFGAIGGTADPRKGADLLLKALHRVKARTAGSHMELLIFGQSRRDHTTELGFPVHYMGHLYDDISLRLVYAAADVMVVPSRMEAFGQTASEAQAVGIPVVAFDIGGLSDIVSHRETGWLAKGFDIDDMAEGISWIISDETIRKRLSSSARKKALDMLSPASIVEQYARVYESAVNGSK
jgi:glycosyltransferase involved in cell wall biosynthesis